jgi:diacylglycerol kinase family enzyme
VNDNSVPIRSVLVIANPVAGGGRGAARGQALVDALVARGIRAEGYVTRKAGDAAARARAAGGEPWDALVAVGGDGTVNEVLNGMPDPSRPLGVLPLGTANVLAAELRLPRAVGPAAAAIAIGRTRALAVGQCGDRRFLLFCGVGVDGAVVQRLHEARSSARGKRKWLGPILHTLWHWPRFSLRATFPDGEVLDGLSSVLVTRVRNYGGVLRLPREVSCDSGRLHVLCFRQRSRVAWLGLGLAGALRCLRTTDALQMRSTASVQIDGDAPFQIDGDFGGRSPIAVQVGTTAVRILA